jgi:hypothetical protein
LYRIQANFGVGEVYKAERNVYRYMVRTPEDLDLIINHFDKYPLITQKQADYLLFKSAFELIKCKAHLSLEGLDSLVKIKASINKGLSDKLKEAFPNTIPVARPLVVDQKIKDPY